MDQSFFELVESMTEQDLEQLLFRTVDPETREKISQLSLGEKQQLAAKILAELTTDVDEETFDSDDSFALPDDPDDQGDLLLGYSKEELGEVEYFISSQFGQIEEVLHETNSPDLPITIALIPPSEERPFHTLATMGMGAYEMEVPPEYQEEIGSRLELLLTLPPHWDLGDQSDERNSWPVRLLRTLARLPLYSETFLDVGHCVTNQAPYAENTGFTGALLLYPYTGEREPCRLPSGELVHFLQVVPLYDEEMDFKFESGVSDLLERCGDGFDFLIDIHRGRFWQ